MAFMSLGPRLLESDPLPRISDRASADLQFIRSTMENASSFAFPGRSWIAMGVTALAAARLATYFSASSGPGAWLAVWGVEAVLGASLGFGGLLLQSTRPSPFSVSTPACRFAAQLLPNLFVALILTPVLWTLGQAELLPAIWCLLYGAAIVAARPVTNVEVIRAAGLCFVACGVVGLCLPAGLGDVLMACSFGVIHIAFGFWMARKSHVAVE